MDGRSRLAWNVRRLRVAKGFSQESLAVDAGVAPPYVSRIETGVANASIDVIDRLARALRVDVDDLLKAYDGRASWPKTLMPGKKALVRRSR